MSEDTEVNLVYDRRVRWEYRRLTFTSFNPENELMTELEKAGSEGFELVTVSQKEYTPDTVPIPGSPKQYSISAIIKRPYRYFTDSNGNIVVDIVV